MNKTLSAVLICLLLASSVEAKPPWYKSWKVWTVVGISVASSIAATHWSHECRVKFGPAPCQGGYGEFAAREAIRLNTSLVMSGLAIYGYNADYKEWAVPALGFAAYNTTVAFRQTRVGCPAGQEFVYGTKFTCKPADEFRVTFRK